MKAIIQDYNADEELSEPQDPNGPMEVEASLLELLAKAVTHAEEAVQVGEWSVDSDEFYLRRGDFLDVLDNPMVAEFLDYMRKQNRCPFKRFPVKS
jgi:hypothetical protein